MENKDFSDWCKTATSKIRFRPDRTAVAMELLAHLEDRRDAFIEKGLRSEEACQQALAAMGSAEEIAPQLGAIHRPHLARFCRLVTILAVFLLFVELLLLCVHFAYGKSERGNERYEDFGYIAPIFSEAVSNDGKRIYYSTSSPRAHVNGYTIYAKHLAIWQYSEHNTISLELAIDRWLFTDKVPLDVPFSIYDNNGNRLHQQYTGLTYSATSQTSIWSLDYSPEETIQWVEIRCTRDGEDVVFLHIDVNGGDGV